MGVCEFQWFTRWTNYVVSCTSIPLLDLCTCSLCTHLDSLLGIPEETGIYLRETIDSSHRREGKQGTHPARFIQYRQHSDSQTNAIKLRRHVVGSLGFARESYVQVSPRRIHKYYRAAMPSPHSPTFCLPLSSGSPHRTFQAH